MQTIKLRLLLFENYSPSSSKLSSTNNRTYSKKQAKEQVCFHCEKYSNFSWFPGLEILNLCLSAKFTHQEIRWSYSIFFSVCIRDIMRLIILKMKVKMKNWSQRYDINNPRSRHGDKYKKYKKCLTMIMLASPKQHLKLNSWKS